MNRTAQKCLAVGLCIALLLMGWLLLRESDADGPLMEPLDAPNAVFEVPEDMEVKYPEAGGSSDDIEDSAAAADEPALGGFAVSSSSAEATWAGMHVLTQGGNAVDAAVAMAFTLGVTEPYSSGLGGSGFMLVYDPVTDKAYCLDYYGCAGSSGYLRDEVAVPGLLKGMDTALSQWGTLSLSETLEPAIYYAENGFLATASFISRLNYSDRLRSNSAFKTVEQGDLVVQAELGETLKRIQQEGISLFYNGEIAQDIANKCGLSPEDLADYQVYITDAIESEFNDYRILTANAPSSGVTVAQMLAMAEELDIPDPDADTEGYLSVLKTCTRKAYARRLSTVADPRYREFSGEYYVSEEYISRMLQDTTAEASVADAEKMCTTQYSVIDGNGMIVCVTNTLSDNWGSYQYVDGFYLNNTLSNFSETGINAYEPGKRPRTHFAPTIVLGEDGYCLAIGSPGGNNIPRIIVPVLIDILKFGEDVQTAIDKSRAMYDENEALCLETEDNAPSIVSKSRIKGSYYYSSQHIYFGCTSVVGYDPDSGVFGAADRRRETSQALVYYYGQEE